MLHWAQIKCCEAATKNGDENNISKMGKMRKEKEKKRDTHQPANRMNIKIRTDTAHWHRAAFSEIENLKSLWFRCGVSESVCSRDCLSVFSASLFYDGCCCFLFCYWFFPISVDAIIYFIFTFRCWCRATRVTRYTVNRGFGIQSNLSM